MNISTQKYKIWINTAWMVFISAKDFKSFPHKNYALLCVLTEPTTNLIRSFIDKMYAGEIDYPVLIVSKNKKTLWQKLLDHCPVVYAAGGIIKKRSGPYLFIYRRGWWDLPKGKLDIGETNRKAALREVYEEVGLKCKILSSLPFTFHCYQEQKRLVIKQTAWYLMECSTSVVKLQKEEDISQCKWVTKKRLKAMQERIYPNLRPLLDSIT